jgi:hypothetical protein
MNKIIATLIIACSPPPLLLPPLSPAARRADRPRLNRRNKADAKADKKANKVGPQGG